MEQDNFLTRLFAAQDAGLNSEWSIKVAYKDVTLDEALGGMDHQSESEAIGYNPSNVTTDEHDCGCRGHASCKDCIPF